MRPVDRATAEHYNWGDRCNAWTLVSQPGMLVVEEEMPPGTEEQPHFHETARQFFYVLSGTLSLRLPKQAVKVDAGQGFEVTPGLIHQALNDSTEVVRFVLISVPTSRGDRINVQPHALQL